MNITFRKKGYTKSMRFISFLLTVMLLLSMLIVGSIDTITASAVSSGDSFIIDIDNTFTQSEIFKDRAKLGVVWWKTGYESSKKVQLIDTATTKRPVTFQFPEDCDTFIVVRLSPSCGYSTSRSTSIGSWFSNGVCYNQSSDFTEIGGTTLFFTAWGSSNLFLSEWRNDLPIEGITETLYVRLGSFFSDNYYYTASTSSNKNYPAIEWWQEGDSAHTFVQLNENNRINDPNLGGDLMFAVPLDDKTCDYLRVFRMKSDGSNVNGSYYNKNDYYSSNRVNKNYGGGEVNCIYITNQQNSTPTDWQYYELPYIPPATLMGQMIYFKDMTGYAYTSSGGVKATFTSSGFPDAPPVNVDMTYDVNESGKFSVEIPSDYYNTDASQFYSYDQVKFTIYEDPLDENAETFETEQWKLLIDGVTEQENKKILYDKNTLNTYYFGPTETLGNEKLADYKANDSENDLSYWYQPTSSASLNGKKLYFDNSVFKFSADDYLDVGYSYGMKHSGRMTALLDSKLTTYTINEDKNILQSDVFTIRYSDNGKKYHFLWFDAVNHNLTTLTDGIAFVKGIYTAPPKRRIYFDASLSKLSYISTDSGYNELPSSTDVYCYSASAGTSKKMFVLDSAKATDGTPKSIFYLDDVDISKGVRFSYTNTTSASGSGSTDLLTVPAGLVNPCFYANSSDDVIYTNKSREGYWDELGTIRDPEAQGEVVDIKKSNFERKVGTLYVPTTFYDYYTDYELNGKNRDTYSDDVEFSYRMLYPYRQFNQALSDYYKKSSSITNPLYEGHFQPAVWHPVTIEDPDPIGPFYKIASTLDLFGWNSSSSDSGNYRFLSNNNSLYDFSGNTYSLQDKVSSKANRGLGLNSGNEFSYVTQGLAGDSLVDGNIVMSDDDKTVIPYFNEEFLTEKNSKDTKLAKIYNNVLFPFEKVKKDNGIEYWIFDSKETTLAMRQDPSSDQYFLHNTGHQAWSRNRESGGAVKTGSQTYGFFPFNENSDLNGDSNGVVNRYNYGYGMKLEFTFRLTKDGKVLDDKNNEQDIEFTFSGDDDVWVYIDGKLALDVGGEHGAATGTLDFAKNTAYVSAVKQRDSSDTYSGYKGRNADSKGMSSVTSTFTLDGDGEGGKLHSNTTEHTLVMYYMERGMWESNLHVEFNFPDSNELEITKNVNTSGVGDDFKKYFRENAQYTFDIDNLVTHYGEHEATGDDGVNPEHHFAINFNNIDSLKSVPKYDASEQTVYYNVGKNLDGISGEGATDDIVLKWSAKEDIQQHSTTDPQYVERRMVTFKADDSTPYPDSQSEYMRFQVWVPPMDSTSSEEDSNGLDLSKMYIRITSEGGGYIHGYLTTSRLLGIPDLTPGDEGKWVTVRVLLDYGTTGLRQVGSFRKNQITSISFQYDDAQTIYLNDFIFQPTTTLSATTGFTTNQMDIADYGSAKSGKLEAVTGAVYTTDNAKPNIADASSTRTVGTEGQIYLKNGETVRFTDQFRRGSYLYINELLSKAQKRLFSTKWTMYENNEIVKSFNTEQTDYAVNGDVNLSMNNVNGTFVRDNRTEKALHQEDIDGFDAKIIHNSYTISNYEDHMKSHTEGGSLRTEYRYSDLALKGVQPNLRADDYYTGAPDDVADTIVFRSYKAPNDIVSNPLKLKIVYENTPKVGVLRITKQQAKYSQPLGVRYSSGGDLVLTKYKFYVEFTNIGGIGLEESPLLVGPFELAAGESKDISGIPVGTEYRIHEVVPTDGSSLQSVERTGASIGADTNDEIKVTPNPEIHGTVLTTSEGEVSTRYVDGTILSETGRYENTFYNYKFSVSVNIKKTWNKSPDADKLPIIYPEHIYVQLQRANTKDQPEDNTQWEPWEVVKGYEVVDIKKPAQNADGTISDKWTLNDITGLPMYENNDGPKGLYAYRIVEYQLTFDPEDTTTKGIILGSDGAYIMDELNKFLVDEKTLSTSTPEPNNQNFKVEYSDPKYGNGDTTDEVPLDLSVTNTLQNETYVSHKVTKIWANGNPSGDGDGTEITLTLQKSDDESDPPTTWTDFRDVKLRYKGTKVQYCNNPGEPTETWKDLPAGNIVKGTSDESVSWTYMFNGLPEKSPEGNKYKYQVVEKDIPRGYYIDEEKHTTTDSTITNSKLVQNLPEAGAVKVISVSLLGGIAFMLSIIAIYLYRKRKFQN